MQIHYIANLSDSFESHLKEHILAIYVTDILC